MILDSIIGVAFAFGSYFFCSLMELDMLAAYHLHVIDLFLHPTAFCLSKTHLFHRALTRIFKQVRHLSLKFH